MQWFRIWHDMLNDPKWRVVAQKSNTRVCEVVSVALAILNSASQNDERGVYSIEAEDIAAALDIDEGSVGKIIAAMEGRFVSGGKVIQWEKRQPKREDNATERTRAWRQRNRTQCDAPVTQCDAPDSDSDSEKSQIQNQKENKETSKLHNNPPREEVEVFPKKKNDYSIVPLLSETGLQAARKVADGWDVYHLAAIFNENVRLGKMEAPKFANKAFPAWCARYTKGSHPA